MNKKMNKKVEITEEMVKELAMKRLNAIIKICKGVNGKPDWSYFEKQCEKYGLDIEVFKAMWN